MPISHSRQLPSRDPTFAPLPMHLPQNNHHLHLSPRELWGHVSRKGADVQYRRRRWPRPYRAYSHAHHLICKCITSLISDLSSIDIIGLDMSVTCLNSWRQSCFFCNRHLIDFGHCTQYRANMSLLFWNMVKRSCIKYQFPISHHVNDRCLSCCKGVTCDMWYLCVFTGFYILTYHSSCA